MWAISLLLTRTLFASDHADPIDLFRTERLEPGITDLFFFPVDENDNVVAPYVAEDKLSLAEPNLKPRKELTAEERAKIKFFVVIVCVRRELTDTNTLRLEPFTYRIQMDLNTAISFEDDPVDIQSQTGQPEASRGYSPVVVADEANEKPKPPSGQQALARYGGKIPQPENIAPNVTIEFGFNNDATLRGRPTFTGLQNSQAIGNDNIRAGVFDDPFIFPPFFGTNVVAIALRIPVTCFPPDQKDWIIWATSHEGERQIDHVGRSLRTQNPRFELLNTLPPSEHAQAIFEEHEDPSLMRDLFLRANMQSLFAYRKWDFVPDVMIYTNRFPVGFPNGRLLTDDVAAMLAQHGDTLLLELSHHGGGWPRATTNDKAFEPKLPFLAAPHPDRPQRAPYTISTKNKFKLAGIAIALVLFLVLENWIVARWYYRKRMRRKYL
jgi:hypothetical protein